MYITYIITCNQGDSDSETIICFVTKLKLSVEHIQLLYPLVSLEKKRYINFVPKSVRRPSRSRS